MCFMCDCVLCVFLYVSDYSVIFMLFYMYLLLWCSFVWFLNDYIGLHSLHICVAFAYFAVVFL